MIKNLFPPYGERLLNKSIGKSKNIQQKKKISEKHHYRKNMQLAFNHMKVYLI